MTQVTIELMAGRPPNTAVGARVPRWPSRTHSTQCWPTGAARRQSGQAARPHRLQDR